MDPLAAIAAIAKVLEQGKINDHQSYHRDNLIRFRKEEREAWERWLDYTKSINDREPTPLERARLDYLESDFLFYRELREAAGRHFGMAGKQDDRDLSGVVKAVVKQGDSV